MAVVVNEFEVVSERGAPPGQAAPPAAGEGAHDASDSERLLAELHERARRVRAY